MNTNMEYSWLLQIILFLLTILSTTPKHRSDQGDCGHPIGSYTTGKIVGGYDIGYYKYPWYVALMRNDIVFCGGTLIASKFIVTAAHCFQPFFNAVDTGHTKFEKIFKPMLGVYNICSSEPTQKEFTVKKVHVHEKYRTMDPYYDIALIKLEEEAKGFQPCCLPKTVLPSWSRPKEGFISGLGDLKYGTTKETCTMHEARVLLYNDKACKDMLDSQGEDSKKFKNAFCAGYLQGEIDTCQGDSGGPLIISNRRGRFSLLGITSFGFDCAKPGALGIYTDVSRFLRWIKNKMKVTGVSSTPVTTPDELPSEPIVNPPESFETDDPDITVSSVLPQESSSSINWSLYPATPWEFSTFPSLQQRPPHRPPYLHRPLRPITIVINIKGKQMNRLHKKQTHKHQKGA